MNEQPYIFISYKGEDPEAITLIDQLRARGYRIWYDRRIRGGTSWLQGIAEALGGSRCMLSLLTEAYLDSEWCLRELLTAQELGKPVTPVIMAHALPPALLGATECFDAVRRGDYDTQEAFLHALLRAEGVSDCYGGAAASPNPLSDPDEAAPTEFDSGALGITCEVKPLGTSEWHPIIQAQCGDTARFRVHVTSRDDILLEKLCVRSIIPTGLSYVPGSTSIANPAHPRGVAVSDRLIEDSGMNLGDYAPHGGFWLYFNTVVTPAAYARGGNVILRTVVQTSAGYVTGTAENYADVLIRTSE